MLAFYTSLGFSLPPVFEKIQWNIARKDLNMTLAKSQNFYKRRSIPKTLLIFKFKAFHTNFFLLPEYNDSDSSRHIQKNFLTVLGFFKKRH